MTAAVPAGGAAVHPDGGLVIDGPELQDEAASLPCGRQGDGPAIPQDAVEARVANPAQAALERVRHHDRFREAPAAFEPSLRQPAVLVVELEFPPSVQGLPV